MILCLKAICDNLGHLQSRLEASGRSNCLLAALIPDNVNSQAGCTQSTIFSTTILLSRCERALRALCLKIMSTVLMQMLFAKKDVGSAVIIETSPS